MKLAFHVVWTALFTAALLVLQHGCIPTTQEDCDEAVRNTLVFDDQYAIAIEVRKEGSPSSSIVYRTPGTDSEVYYQCDLSEQGEHETKLIMLKGRRIDKEKPKPAEAPQQ